MTLAERFHRLFPQMCTSAPQVDGTSYRIIRSNDWKPKEYRTWSAFHINLEPSRKEQGKTYQNAVLMIESEGACRRFPMKKEELRSLAFYLTEVINDWDKIEHEYRQEYEKLQHEYLSTKLNRS